MTDEVRRLGGVARTFELRRAGASPKAIAASVHHGLIIRAHQGRFVLPDSPDDVIRATRVGGRATGATAARLLGLAVPAEFPLHVQVERNAARLRDPSDRLARLDRDRGDAVIHHGRLVADGESSRTMVSVIDCLRAVIATETLWDAVACVDSARIRGLLDEVDFARLAAVLPDHARRVIELSVDNCPEYLESVFRVRLAEAGMASRTQVNVLDERWIDVLVGDRLAFECDGKGKYERGASVTSDRLRDAFLEALGYHVIRISYAMVLYDWDATLSMILAILERGDHLSRPRH